MMWEGKCISIFFFFFCFTSVYSSSFSRLHRKDKKLTSQQEEDDPTITEFLLGRPLEKNMVLTVEPGLYFNDAMLNIWTQFPGYQDYFNLHVLAKYRSVGGVRIEDTIVITDDGYENLTLAPKQVHEIEALMNMQ